MYSNLWQVPFVIKIINIIHFIQFCHWSVGVSVCVCTLKRIHSTILNQCMGSNSSHVVIILGFDLCWFRWHFGDIWWLCSFLRAPALKKCKKQKTHTVSDRPHTMHGLRKKRNLNILAQYNYSNTPAESILRGRSFSAGGVSVAHVFNCVSV